MYVITIMVILFSKSAKNNPRFMIILLLLLVMTLEHEGCLASIPDEVEIRRICCPLILIKNLELTDLELCIALFV